MSTPIAAADAPQDRPALRRVRRLPGRLDRFDRGLAHWFRTYGVRALRYALAAIFILFGILKPLGISPAEDLVLKTAAWVPLMSPRAMLYAIGWWEVAIGLCLLFRPLVRLGILLLAVQMVGTFLPLVVVPEACYVQKPALGGDVHDVDLHDGGPVHPEEPADHQRRDGSRRHGASPPAGAGAVLVNGT